MEVFTAALVLALKLGLPVLIAAVVIGLIIAILQAATQVHEQTLSFAPKAIVVAIVLLLFGPWMMNKMCIRDSIHTDGINYSADDTAKEGNI